MQGELRLSDLADRTPTPAILMNVQIPDTVDAAIAGLVSMLGCTKTAIVIALLNKRLDAFAESRREFPRAPVKKRRRLGRPPKQTEISSSATRPVDRRSRAVADQRGVLQIKLNRGSRPTAAVCSGVFLAAHCETQCPALEDVIRTDSKRSRRRRARWICLRYRIARSVSFGRNWRTSAATCSISVGLCRYAAA